MTLSDTLAIQRTQLANERTWLAYVRTGLTFFVAGVSFVQFFSAGLVRCIGWTFIPVGVVTLVVGYRRYRACHRLTREATLNTHQ
jgi:putative membrane protein